MGILTNLGLEYKTDKATYHNFTDFYEEHLRNKRNDVKNILEIGVFYGGSLKMWKNYFTNANIFGIDTENKETYNDERIKTFVCEQTNRQRLDELFKDDSLDLIIDDGGHTMQQQQLSLVYLTPKLKSGGIYIIEDLHTSLLYGRHLFNKKGESTLDLVQCLSQGIDFKSDYINYSDFENIKKNYKSIFIFENVQNDDYGKSITCVMYKT